jgi:RNA polymerase sigma factor (sigma-70 family)
LRRAELDHDPEESSVSVGHPPSAAPAAPTAEAKGPPHDADRDIVEALSRGETRLALALCVERHSIGIGRLCMAMLDSQSAADDVTFETLLGAHECFGELSGGGSVRAWLLGNARHKCLEQLEKSRGRRSTPTEPRGEDAAGAQGAVAARRRAERARGLLEHVRPSDRDALLLRYGADSSFEEVAAASGIDAVTAKQRASRALSRLRGLLESEPGDTTDPDGMCSAVDEHMCDVIDGVAEDALFDHLAQCERCRDARYGAEQVLVRVAEAASDYRVPEDLSARLAAALDARRGSRTSLIPAAVGEKLASLRQRFGRGSVNGAESSLAPPEISRGPRGHGAGLDMRPDGALPSARWAWLSLAAAIGLGLLWLGSRHDPDKDKPALSSISGGLASAWQGQVVRIERAFGSPSGLIECAPGTQVCHPLAPGDLVRAGMRLETDGLTRALLELADGSRLSLDRQSGLQLDPDEPRRGRLLAGNLIGEIERRTDDPRSRHDGDVPGHAIIDVPRGRVEIVGTKLSVRADEDGARVEVSRGSVRLFDAREQSVLVQAGEAGVIGQDRTPRVERVLDLGQALGWSSAAFEEKSEPDQQGALGELIAKRPRDGQELSGAVQLTEHHVAARIVDNVARTQIEEVFENRTGEVLEGIYRFPLPPGAQIERLALEVDGKLVEGAFVDRERAAAIWRGAVVNAGGKPPPPSDDIVWVPGPWRDPALLEWQRGSRFELRVFPIPARGSRRVVLAYTEVLPPSEGARTYVYPLPRDPRQSTRIARFTLEVQVRGHDVRRGVAARGYPLKALSGSPEVARLAYDQNDFMPSGDLRVTYELAHPDAELRTWVYQPKSAEPDVSAATSLGRAGEAARANGTETEDGPELPADAPFVALAIKPALPRRARHEPRDYVLVADTSRSMIGESYRRAISVIARIIREMDRGDRVTLLACDASCQVLPGGPLRPSDATAEAAVRFLEGIEPEGASDLAFAVERAAALRDVGLEQRQDPKSVDSPRSLRVIYVGDGSPTVGPIHPALLDRAIAEALPRGASLSAVAVGSDADRGALRVATRAGGGVSVAFTPGESAQDVAYAVLGASYGHSLQNARLTLPEGMVRVMPQRIGSIAAGAEELVVARLTRPHVQGDVILTGEVAGEPFERRFAVELGASPGEANAFVPRLYAGVAIAELEASMDERARRRSIELSTRYNVASRYTSLLVLESPAMFTAFGLDNRRTAPEWSGDRDSQKSESTSEQSAAALEDEPSERESLGRDGPASDAARPARSPLGTGAVPGNGTAGADRDGDDERRTRSLETAQESNDGDARAPEKKAASTPAVAGDEARDDPYAESNPYGPERSNPDALGGDELAEGERQQPLQLPERRLIPMRRVLTRVARIAAPPSPLVATLPERRQSLELRARDNAESRDALRRLFVVDLLAGDLDAAARAADHWLTKDPLDVDALTARADVAAQRGDRERAIRILGSVVDVRPGDYKAQWRLARLHRWAGRPERGCRHSLAVAQLMLQDAKLVAEAVGCAREVGQGRVADELLAALEPGVRREVDQLVQRRRTSDDLSGDFRVAASWQGSEHDVDVVILNPEGYRVSWLGAPTRAVITANDVLSVHREELALRGAPPGQYAIEVTRSSSAPGLIRGTLRLMVADAERDVPFVIEGERARVATVTLRNETRLVPLERWD